MKNILTGLLIAGGAWFIYNKFVNPVPVVTPPVVLPPGGNILPGGGGIKPPENSPAPEGGDENNNYTPNTPNPGGSDVVIPASGGDIVTVLNPPTVDPFGADKGHGIGKTSI